MQRRSVTVQYASYSVHKFRLPGIRTLTSAIPVQRGSNQFIQQASCDLATKISSIMKNNVEHGKKQIPEHGQYYCTINRGGGGGGGGLITTSMLHSHKYIHTQIIKTYTKWYLQDL